MTTKFKTVKKIVEEVVENNVFKQGTKKNSQIARTGKYKIKVAVKKYYQNNIKKKISKTKVSKIVDKVTKKLDYFKMYHNVKYNLSKYFAGSFSSSLIGQKLEKVYTQIVGQDIYDTIEIFSSVGNFIATLLEIDYDGNIKDKVFLKC